MIDLKKKEIKNKKLELFENRQKFQAFLVEEPKIANKMDVIENNLMTNNWLAKHLERNVDKRKQKIDRFSNQIKLVKNLNDGIVLLHYEWEKKSDQHLNELINQVKSQMDPIKLQITEIQAQNDYYLEQNSKLKKMHQILKAELEQISNDENNEQINSLLESKNSLIEKNKKDCEKIESIEINLNNINKSIENEDQENEKLKEKLDQLKAIQAKIEQLKDEENIRKLENEHLMSENDKLDLIIKESEAQIELIQVKENDQNIILLKLNQKLEQSKLCIEEKSIEFSIVESQLNELKNKESNLNQNLNMKREQFQEKEILNIQLNAQLIMEPQLLTELQSECSSIETEVNDLTTKLETIDPETKMLDMEHKQVQEKISQKKLLIQSFVMENMNILADIVPLYFKRKTFLSNLNNDTQTIEELVIEKVNENDLLETLQRELSSKNSHFRFLEQKVNLNENQQRLGEMVIEMKPQCEELQRLIKEKDDEINMLQLKNKQCNEKIESIQSKNDELVGSFGKMDLNNVPKVADEPKPEKGAIASILVSRKRKLFEGVSRKSVTFDDNKLPRYNIEKKSVDDSIDEIPEPDSVVQPKKLLLSKQYKNKNKEAIRQKLVLINKEFTKMDDPKLNDQDSRLNKSDTKSAESFKDCFA